MDDSARFPNLDGALSHASFRVTHEVVSGHDALIARRSEFRWSWFATRLHVFVVAVTVERMARDAAEGLVAAAQQYAISGKPGLLRGLQTGTATIATVVCRNPSDELKAWFRNKPHHRYAAVCLPVLADLTDQRLVRLKGRMPLGYIYVPYLHDLVTSILAPGLGCEA